ncbi:hypothetical protein VTN00DRAFT_4550 [Thermoascus crustaceus]|uniref:uncharacterized protein n=1 Tax=Thermoascus crustaceus TaxID=5088 RepID=UPI0037422432
MAAPSTRSRAELAIGGRFVPCPGLRRFAVIVASDGRSGAPGSRAAGRRYLQSQRQPAYIPGTQVPVACFGAGCATTLEFTTIRLHPRGSPK